MIKAIVTDIEGTISSLAFVRGVLFPYARAHMGGYVREHADNATVAALLDDVRAEVGKDLSLEEVIAQLITWIDEDKKITPLKTLQGLMWEEGYKAADLRGHVYVDAMTRLVQWNHQGIPLYVYSSGSVYAQKLLFGYTEYGDMNKLFSGYFDTRVGAKVEATSYERIAQSIGVDAADILFLSDVEAELDAARAAGMQTVWLVREGHIHPFASHQQVRDFESIKGPRIAALTGEHGRYE
jgi:enolase-phosphatase E1